MRRAGKKRRNKPLVAGWATVGDYRKISAIITCLVVVLAVYLTTQRADGHQNISH
jgi:hypothetical protein